MDDSSLASFQMSGETEEETDIYFPQYTDIPLINGEIPRNLPDVRILIRMFNEKPSNFKRPLLYVFPEEKGDDNKFTFELFGHLVIKKEHKSRNIDFSKLYFGDIKITSLSQSAIIEGFCWLPNQDWAVSYFSQLAKFFKLEPRNGDKLSEKNPWDLIIEQTGWDIEALRLWINGYSNSEIAERVHVVKRRVTNRISELRIKYGPNLVPYDKDRKMKLRRDMK